MIDLRASGLSELFDCPARWEARHLRGLRLPRSGAAQLGTAVHAGTATYDAARMGGDLKLTADDAAGPLVDAIHRPDADVAWDEITPREAEGIALDLHHRYCREIAPGQDYVGVEVTCQRLEIADLGIALTGTTDRVRRCLQGLGVVDLKTGGRAVGTDGRASTQGHGIQLAVYELLAAAAIGEPITAPAQIVGLQTAKTERGRRVGVGEIVAARGALVGDLDRPGLLEHAARILQTGSFYGNPRSTLCNPKYCPAHGTCHYRV